MAPLPLIKIAAVLFKEVSKPLATKLKAAASEHPRLRGLAIGLGRGYERGVQRVEVLWSGNRIKSFKHIPDAHALTVGADLLVQGFLLSSAMLLVVAEYVRNAQVRDAERVVAAERKAERQAVKGERLRRLEADAADALARVERLERAIAAAEAAAGAAAAAAEGDALAAAAVGAAGARGGGGEDVRGRARSWW